jgi:uncharacterized protein (DUF2235 family)
MTERCETQRPAGKNIVICCDGTNNTWRGNISNIIKIFRSLERDDPNQIAFYSPGIGTFSVPGWDSPFSSGATKIFGLAFGLGYSTALEAAYSYLVAQYQPGDRIWLFGFSRGAYTVRALAAMIFQCGILYPGDENLVPIASQAYRTVRADRRAVPEQYLNDLAFFRATFGRPADVYFVGVWDTVDSIGGGIFRITSPFLTENPDIHTIRQAIAIDERRTMYRPIHWQPTGAQDLKEVWFAGVHGDIGGSYPEKESGLAAIALKWMVDEAKKSGLLINEKRYSDIIGNGNPPNLFAAPDHCALMHRRSLGWSVFDSCISAFPTRDLDDPDNPARNWGLGEGGKRRTIPKGAFIHQSVLDRIRDVAEYRPTNLPSSPIVEPSD